MQSCCRISTVMVHVTILHQPQLTRLIACAGRPGCTCCNCGTLTTPTITRVFFTRSFCRKDLFTISKTLLQAWKPLYAAGSNTCYTLRYPASEVLIICRFLGLSIYSLCSGSKEEQLRCKLGEGAAGLNDLEPMVIGSVHLLPLSKVPNVVTSAHTQNLQCCLEFMHIQVQPCSSNWCLRPPVTQIPNREDTSNLEH